MAKVQRAVTMTENVVQIIEDVSSTLGVNKTVVVNALIEGAFRSGRWQQYVQEFLVRYPDLRQTSRLAAKSLAWELTGDRRWEFEGWILTRIGIGGPHDREGDGWYLDHPSLAKPRHVGMTGPEAKKAAAEIILAAREEHRTWTPT